MKRLIKYTSFFLGILILLVSILIGIFWWKYSSIVGSIPHNEFVEIKPGKYGQYVNTFIGTGGFPAWVCGQNFPGATVTFGMVRLSPETASLFFDINGIPAILASFENLLLLLLTFKVLRKKPLRAYKAAPIIIKWLLILLIIGTFVFSQALGNLGIMLRMRNMFLPGMLIFILWALSYEKMIFYQQHNTNNKNVID